MKAPQIAQAICEGSLDAMFVDLLRGDTPVTPQVLRRLFPDAAPEEIGRGIRIAVELLELEAREHFEGLPLLTKSKGVWLIP